METFLDLVRPKKKHIEMIFFLQIPKQLFFGTYKTVNNNLRVNKIIIEGK